MNICPKCGLPTEACVCQEIAKTKQHIRIEVIKRKFGKLTTVISGLEKTINMKELARKLKQELACGGTVKNDTIELQGGHKKKVEEILKREGFAEEQMD